MARFDIISKDGDSVRYSGKPRYNGSYLRPSYIEFSEIASPAPISWEVGDYLDYPRTGMRYRLYSIPQASKNARKDSHGKAFTYSNVQLHAATKELEIAPFRDLVSNDNSTHFSTSPDVATFEDVYGIARRIQACMDNLYPGRWEIRVADFDATDDADIIEKITTAKEFALSGGTCLDALSRIYELWQDVGWVHTYEADKEVIIIGYPNKRVDENTSDAFLYGKGNGLTAIKKNQTNKEEFATRLYVYGSERNLPARYYNGKDILNAESVDIRNLMLPIDSWGKTDGIPDARKAYIENVEAVSKYGVIPKTHYFDSEDAGGEIYPSISKITIGQIRSALSALGETQYLPNQTLYPVDGERVDKIKIGSLISDNGVINPTGQTYEQTKSVLFSEDIRTTVLPSGSSSEVTFQEEVMINDLSFDGHPYGEVTLESENISFSIEDSSIKSAIATFVLSDMYSTTIKKTQIVVAKQDGDVWSISFPKLSLSFDQSERHNFPIVLSVSVSVTPKESSISNRTITLTRTSGVIKAGFNTILIKTFTIYLKQIGFDINERASQGNDKAITMKSGSCKGRSFIISNSRYKESTDTWELTCKRQQDDTLGLMFPNKDYQIAAGDEFAILGISMPELYVLANSQRLLSEGKKLLARASTIQNLYEPSIDAKVMAESGRVLREGMFMKIKDEDIVDNTIDFILIDTLSIYEDEGAIPTYKVTLRERRKVTYKGTPSVTSPTETQPVEESKSSSDVDLSGYATEEYVNKRVSNAEKDIEDLATLLSSMWRIEDGKIVTDMDVLIKDNLIVEGDTSSGGSGDSGGSGEDVPAGGTVTGVKVNGVTYEPTAGIVTIPDYPTSLTWEAINGKPSFATVATSGKYSDLSGLPTIPSLDGYATEVYVRNQIAGIDLSPYATKTDVSTAIANLINGAPTTLDTLKEIADALAENEDVVEALEAAIGTKANASDVYTKSQIDAEFEDYETALATKAAKSDLTTLQGYFSNGIAKKATADASGNVITTYYTPITTHNALATRVGAAETNITNLTKNKADKATTLSGYGITNAYTKTEIDTKVTTINNTISGVSGRVTTLETWKSDISKYITIVNGNVKISTNLIVTGDTSSGGSGEDTGAEGTVTGVIVGTTKYESVSAGLLNLTSLMALYTPVSTHNVLAGRVTALEGKATAVSFTQTLTSGTKIGTITIDGVAKNIYTPTIPTNVSSFTNDKGYLTGITKSMVDTVLGGTASANANKFLMCTGSTTVWSATPTKLSQFTDDVVSGKYLPLAGGTIAGTNFSPLHIKSSSSSYAGLGFRLSGSTYSAYFIYKGDTTWVVTGENWTGEQKLLHSGNYSSYALPKSGGTISSDSYIPLTLDTTSIQCRVQFKVSGTDKALVGYHPTYGSWLYNYASGAFISVYDDGTPHYNNYALIHSGNIGSQSVQSAKDALRFKGLASSGDLNTVLAGGGMARTYSRYLTADFTNAPIGAYYGTVLQLSVAGFVGLDALSGQLAWDINHNSTTDATRYLWWRAADQNGFTNSRWHQIAFTDSNVASATKLATARTIWGQSFDGTGNVSGALSKVKSIQMPTTNYTRTALNTEGDALRVGDPQGQLQIRGSSIIMQHAEGQTDIRINDNGNITIGGGVSDLAGTSVKLYVNGVARASAFRSANIGIECDADGNTSGYGSEINRFGSSLYLQTREGNLYLSHTAGTTYIRGLASITGAVTMSSTLSVGGNITPSANSSYTLGTSTYRWSTIYGTHGNFSASVTATTAVVTPLLQASGGLDIVANGSAAGSRLFLTSNCFRPWGDDSKLIDLGSSSIQWRNLYAVGATFSGEVLPSIDNGGQIGNSENRWAFIYAFDGYFSNMLSARYEIYSGGDIRADGNAIIAGDTSSGSDIRFKDIIKDKTLNIEDIAKAPLFTFKWNDRDDDTVHLGSSAQYWENVCPWLVTGDDFKSLNYATLGVAMGISLAKKAVNHEERIKALEKENKQLKEEIRRMKYGNR